MHEFLSLADICDQFPGEWILVADPDLDDDFEVIRGRVMCHSKDRDEVDQVAVRARLKRAAFIYTGGTEEGTELALAADDTISLWT